ncbi:hypothetical protein BDM02DRAFT_3119875 [Thelephora ganbajun]|uniref:Uncharacterized protein n=1 Tax=Thelephora ganbajun TaxID=370292 RepID=A0ACB6Z7X6_THEGA|nr:hypothetical protein BDM02DRAFT_3119875 [Thelephora ganbajun]
MVHGDSMRSHLLAIIVSDPVQPAKMASRVWKKPVSETNLATLGEAAKDEKVMGTILDVLIRDEVKYGNGMKGYELVKGTFITNELFLVENGCLTPTTKARRQGSTLFRPPTR